MYTICLSATFLKQHLYLFIKISVGTNTTIKNLCLSLIQRLIAVQHYLYPILTYTSSITSLNPRPNSALASYYLGITILSPYYYLYLLIVLAQQYLPVLIEFYYILVGLGCYNRARRANVFLQLRLVYINLISQIS